MVPDDWALPDLEKVPKHVRLIVVIGWNSEARGLFLANSGKLVRMRSYDPAVKPGQIGMNGIIGVFIYVHLRQGKRIRIVARWQISEKMTPKLDQSLQYGLF